MINDTSGILKHHEVAFTEGEASNNSYDSLAILSRSLPLADRSIVRLVTGLTWISFPLTQTSMAYFVPGRAVIDDAWCKREADAVTLLKRIQKFFIARDIEAHVALQIFNRINFAIVKGWGPYRELEADAITLLKRIQKFSIAQDIGARAAVHIFNRISFAIAKGAFRDDVGLSMLLVDCKNAFNLVDREVMLREVCLRCPAILHWIEFCYSNPARLYHDTMVVGKVLELIIEDGPGCGLHLNVDKTEVFGQRKTLEAGLQRVAKTIELMDDIAKINDPQCELLLLSSCTGIYRLYFIMRTCPPRVFESAQRSFDVALRSSLKRIVTTSGPGFGNWNGCLLPYLLHLGGLMSILRVMF
nr:hypothetical protein [Tanacetum cinerariifolium]